MNYKDLSKFTHGELSNFTHAELSLDFSELLQILKSENRAIPVETYDKLKALADRYNVQMPEQPKQRVSTEYIIRLLIAIINLIVALHGSPDVNITIHIGNTEVDIETVETLPSTEEVKLSLYDYVGNLIEQGFHQTK